MSTDVAKAREELVGLAINAGGMDLKRLLWTANAVHVAKLDAKCASQGPDMVGRNTIPVETLASAPAMSAGCLGRSYDAARRSESVSRNDVGNNAPPLPTETCEARPLRIARSSTSRGVRCQVSGAPEANDTLRFNEEPKCQCQSSGKSCRHVDLSNDNRPVVRKTHSLGTTS